MGKYATLRHALEDYRQRILARAHGDAATADVQEALEQVADELAVLLQNQP